MCSVVHLGHEAARQPLWRDEYGEVGGGFAASRGIFWCASLTQFRAQVDTADAFIRQGIAFAMAAARSVQSWACLTMTDASDVLQISPVAVPGPTT